MTGKDMELVDYTRYLVSSEPGVTLKKDEIKTGRHIATGITLRLGDLQPSFFARYTSTREMGRS
jgi:hypothetical protein